MLTSSAPGELPPPAPRACFGRDELIEGIVGFTEHLTPIALVGAGGIGKTSIALAVLHHDRVKQRFGQNRRFIRCDQFPATVAHLLNRLSKVAGAGIENPEGLTPLCPFLSSREILIVLDNAESILDPQGLDAAPIYDLVEELSHLPTLCLCVTSRISTIPPEIETIDIPTLSMDAACDTFYRIYKYGRRSNLINDILERLDFHPLSITLLATVAHQNKWDANRLTKEWERRRTSVLRTQHNKSLAATIELSLASPTFQEFGPNARELLGVIAFFPQGVDEKNLEWLFPTISNGINVFDGFCTLSLTYRSNDFITMLAPLRDYLSPKDPRSSLLLCAAKGHYFTRLSAELNPNEPNFGETRWITSEDVNIEHLLDIFTTIDADSDDVWDACVNFMRHLHWHKQRLTVLRSKIEGLPDGHSAKLKCLFSLSLLFASIGNQTKRKQILDHALKLSKEQEDNGWVALVLWHLSGTNRRMILHEQGIQQAKEALEIFEQLDNVMGQAQCLLELGSLLHSDQQLDAAEEAASRAVRLIDLIPEEGNRHLICRSRCLFGKIYGSKGEVEEAIHHYDIAREIASPFNWHDILFEVHYKTAWLLLDVGGYEDIAHTLAERAKSHAVGHSEYDLGYVVLMQAFALYRQLRFERARSEALRAFDIFQGLGATNSFELCTKLLQLIQDGLNSPVVSDRDSIVSPCNWYRFLRILIFPSKLKETNETIGLRVE